MATFEKILERAKVIAIPIAENMFVGTKEKPLPNPPYLIYTTSEKGYGHDFGNAIKEIEGTFLLFTSRNPDKEIEERIEREVFFDTEYEKEQVFIENQNLFQTAYYITLFEKMRREKKTNG